MSIKKKYQNLIIKFISNDISESEKKELFIQAESDKEIADMLHMHNQLLNKEVTFDLPDEALLKEMRLNTLNRINFIDNQRKNWISLVKDFILNITQKPVFTMAFAVLIFLAGLYIGHPSEEYQLEKSIYATATQSHDLQSSINTPYIYKNATLKEKPDGQVKVSFDVVQHLEITRTKNDPLVQDVLAQSLINSNSVQQRLRSISNTNVSMHPKIKQALITTMLNDSHPIVRQKSLFSLMKYKNDQDIQDALIQLLKNEESVYMKLAAIDYLSNNDVDLTLLEESINTLDNVENSAVNQKIKQLKYKPIEGKL